jgi:hypothetical protein
MSLRMAERLVSGAETAGGLQFAFGEVGGEVGPLAVQPGEDLLPVGVPDRDGCLRPRLPVK